MKMCRSTDKMGAISGEQPGRQRSGSRVSLVVKICSTVVRGGGHDLGWKERNTCHPRVLSTYKANSTENHHKRPWPCSSEPVFLLGVRGRPEVQQGAAGMRRPWLD